MRIAVAATGDSLDERVCKQFARCHCFLIVDPETSRFDAFCHPAHALADNARRAMAQKLAGRNVDVALSKSSNRSADGSRS